MLEYISNSTMGSTNEILETSPVAVPVILALLYTNFEAKFARAKRSASFNAIVEILACSAMLLSFCYLMASPENFQAQDAVMYTRRKGEANIAKYTK